MDHDASCWKLWDHWSLYTLVFSSAGDFELVLDAVKWKLQGVILPIQRGTAQAAGYTQPSVKVTADPSFYYLH